MGRYRFVEHDQGFRVEHPSRAAVDVRVDGWAFVVERARTPTLRFPVSQPLDTALHVRWLITPRRRVPVRSLFGEAADVPPHAWVISGHLLRVRERLLAAVDPVVGRVYDALVAVDDVAPPLAFAEALYREAFLVRDVLAYRAAAVALAFVGSDLRPTHVDAPVADDTAITLLREWRGLFSPTGTTYRSLDRTLMNVPARFPGTLLCALRHLTLDRPIAHGLELAFVCHAADVYAHRGRVETLASHLRVIQHATAREIQDALDVLGERIGRPLSPRRADDVRRLALTLVDRLEPFEGRLQGLLARALRGHDRIARPRTRTPPPDRPTARPPVPLPDHPAIRFLDTEAAVRGEGRRMKHCLADYASNAVEGRCYLFHVEHEDGHASIEVNRFGKVVQASGPHNAPNAATIWGTRHLAAWGRQLLDPTDRAREEEQRMRRLLGRHLALRPDAPG